MAMQTAAAKPEIIYPETDGQPMAENTKQAEVMMTLKENLDALFADRPDVFVAIDLFWYPVEGRPDIRQAPDVMVALGRPKGHRGSYKQWEEGGIPPQVVFEVASPGNTEADWARKRAFYEQYGVQEYYIYNPDTSEWQGYLRQGERLEPIARMEGWVSPLLGIRFERGQETDPGLYDPAGNRFPAYLEVRRALEEAIARAMEERRRAEVERHLREQERQRAEQEYQRAERLAQKLRELGIEIDEDL
ncbi:MAG: Uma2 family endonuclease [Fimbriimonadales bacterium]|nr:Uma2 family endonuclease [Fimbriimonadales bacterium]